MNEHISIGLFSFVQWYINFHVLFNTKAIFEEELQRYYLTDSLGDKGIRNFPKGPKVNVIARLEFELTYLENALQHFSHYTTKTPLHI